MNSGEQKAWEKLSRLNPDDVCKRACVLHDHDNENYILASFGMEFSISPKNRTIKNLHDSGEIFIKKHGYFFILSVLLYLINAKDIPLTNKQIKPENLKGGDIFFKGSHVLPLQAVTEKYGNDKNNFALKAKNLCGRRLNYGNISFEFRPLPRIPITLILWLHDDEFPARADLLFDSSCEYHLSIDILWSLAMMNILAML
ncbi:MAG: DUF3786 domain-containing protein [Nitrospiraceae bacterium]|nr:DUF3786 domain-containing protein [Nitrospiraceae bacterium]